MNPCELPPGCCTVVQAPFAKCRIISPSPTAQATSTPPQIAKMEKPVIVGSSTCVVVQVWPSQRATSGTCKVGVRPAVAQALVGETAHTSCVSAPPGACVHRSPSQ